jgi:hypothetical protein
MVDFFIFGRFIGVASILYSAFWALKPIVTRVLMVHLLIFEFKALTSIQDSPQTLSDYALVMSDLIVGLVIVLGSSAILLLLSSKFKKALQAKQPNRISRQKFTLGIKALVCFWGVLILVISYSLLFEFWLMGVVIFLFTALISCIVSWLVYVKLAIRSRAIQLLVLSYGGFCLYLVLMSTYLLYYDFTAVDFSKVFVLIMLPRVCFGFMAQFAQEYLTSIKPTSLIKVLVSCIFLPEAT